MADVMELGGNITLSGFTSVGPAELIVLKKVLGNHVRRIADRKDFESLAINLKEIHGNEDHHSKYDLKANLSGSGSPINAEVIEHNLFVGIDSLLKKVAAQIR